MPFPIIYRWLAFSTVNSHLEVQRKPTHYYQTYDETLIVNPYIKTQCEQAISEKIKKNI
jgi:hypothetical protein